MKRAGFRDACWWIALNDDAGALDALDVEVVSGMISVCLVADLFGVERREVAQTIVRYRKQNAKAQQSNLVLGQCPVCFAINRHEEGCKRPPKP